MFSNMDTVEWIVVVIIALLVFSLLGFLGIAIYYEVTAPDSGIIYDMAEIEPHYEQNVNTTYVYNGKTMMPMVTGSNSLKERTWVIFIKDPETKRTNKIGVTEEEFKKYKIGDFYR